MSSWLEGNRQWVHSSSGGGGLVPGVPCPKCGARILYNGNYFCEHFRIPTVTRNGDCNWALSHGENGEPVGLRDKNVWKKIKAAVGLPEDA